MGGHSEPTWRTGPASARPPAHREHTRDPIGASLRDLMVRMGHDSPAAALIYQHSSRASDEAIAAALDAQLTARLREAERKSRNGSGAQMGPDVRSIRRGLVGADEGF